MLCEQRLQCLFDRRPQGRRSLAPRQAAQLEVRLSEDDHLAPVVTLRFHEHWVHAHVGLDSGSERLEVLGHADLAAVDDAGVVRHVLRLERHDVETAPGEGACEGGRHEALPG